MRDVMTGLLMAALMMAHAPAAAQPQADLWRTFAEKLEAGTVLTVRLSNGQRFRATLIATREDALLLQPKTRVPVAVQPVPYSAIVGLERRGDGGMSGAKAAVIGVVSGAAAFVAILLILLAATD